MVCMFSKACSTARSTKQAPWPDMMLTAKRMPSELSVMLIESPSTSYEVNTSEATMRIKPKIVLFLGARRYRRRPGRRPNRILAF